MWNTRPPDIAAKATANTGRACLQHNRVWDIEPDVRVSTHPALHEPMPSGYAPDPVALLAQGVAMLSAR